MRGPIKSRRGLSASLHASVEKGKRGMVEDFWETGE